MIRLKDIAEKAGVSVMTVSKALRDEPDIAKATRTRIRAIADPAGRQVALLQGVQGPRRRTRLLPEGAPFDELLEGARRVTATSYHWGSEAPCPSRGETHLYALRVYAVGTDLGLPPRAMHEAVLSTLEGHIVGYGRVSGSYKQVNRGGDKASCSRLHRARQRRDEGSCRLPL